MVALLLFKDVHVLVVDVVARYCPTRKCGKANVNEPNPINIMPQAIIRGFEAPRRPPKYVTGTRHKNEAMS